MKFIFGIIAFEKGKYNALDLIYNKILKMELKNRHFDAKNELRLSMKSFWLNCAFYSSNEINEKLIDGKNQRGIYAGLPFFDIDKTEVHSKIKKLMAQLISNKPSENWSDLGDFIVVYYSEQQKFLLLGRDPFGTIPLYIEKGDGWLAFSSDMRTLYRIRNKNRDYDKQAIGDFLKLSYFHGPRTIFNTVTKLPAMHNLRIADKQIDFVPIKYTITKQPLTDKADIAEQLDKTISNTIAKRMNNIGKPVFTLTGGLDTTGIAVKCLKYLEGEYNSIIGFAEGLPDEELQLSRKAAELLKLNHHEAILKPKEAPKYIKKLASKSSEPIGDTAAVTAELAAEKAAKLGEVTIAGNGGDELFVGYARYRWGLKHLKLKSMLPASVQKKNRVSKDAAVKYLGFLSTCPLDFIRKMLPDYNPDFLEEQTHKFFKDDKGELIKNYMWTDLNNHMIYDQLFLMDQTFQYYNLPCRYPFLDFGLIQVAFRVPAEMSLTKSEARLLQKKWLSEKVRIPDEIVYRKKQGFGAPIDKWISAGLLEYSKKVIFDSKLISDDIFNEKTLNKLLYDSPDIKKINSEIYYFTNLSLWLNSLPKQIGEEI